MNREGAFTLIELLIAVAIVAILAAIAYPSYSDYLRRANRSAAQQFMLEISQREESFFLDNRAYSATLGGGGLNLTAPDRVDDFYSVAIEAAALPPSYRVTATPRAGTIQAGEATLTLDNTGAKGPPAFW